MVLSAISSVLRTAPADGSVLVRYPAAKTADLYEVPETVREIAENAFFEAKIKQIKLSYLQILKNYIKKQM